jgi:hypothetical protein
MSGVTKVDGSRSATPPPLPQSARPLRIAESERGDSRSHWSQGTQALGSASEETLPLDSQTGFPPHRQDDGLPRSVLIVVWLAVAAVMGVLAMMVYRTFF